MKFSSHDQPITLKGNSLATRSGTRVMIKTPVPKWSTQKAAATISGWDTPREALRDAMMLYFQSPARFQPLGMLGNILPIFACCGLAVDIPTELPGPYFFSLWTCPSHFPNGRARSRWSDGFKGSRQQIDKLLSWGVPATPVFCA